MRFTGDERLVLLHGKEDFLRSEGFRLLKKALAERHDPLAVLRFDGAGAALADVLDELRSVGLMAQYKLVVVDEAETFVKDHRPALERYADQPEPSATLLLRSANWRSGNLDKKIAAVGQVVKCEPLTDRTAGPWLTRRCRDHYGCKINGRAASLLIEKTGLDMGRLDCELAKLAVAVPPGGTIDEKVIVSLSGQVGDEAVWHIKQALLSGEPRQALAKLHEMIDLADIKPEQIAWHLTDLAQSLYAGAVAVSKRQSLAGFCNANRIWGPMQKPFTAAVGRLGVTGAAALLATVRRAAA